MESFGNFLKYISESFNLNQQVDDESTGNLNNSGSSNDNSNNQQIKSRKAQINAIKNQAREDDDEEFEARGVRNGRAKLAINSNSGLSTGAIVGLAALAIGGYAIGKVALTKDKKLSETKEEIIQKIKEIEKDTKEYPVVGFDCQWSQTLEGTKRNKISLLQIASHTGNVLLIQINKLYTFPEELKLFLKNRNIIKSGIEVHRDARYLLEDYGLVVIGTFDLRFLAEDTGHRPESLPKLANKILDMELNRDWELIASDWNKDQLDENQIEYGEKAARASIDIFVKLVPFTITTVNRTDILNYCSEYLDRTFIYYSQNY